VNERGVQNGGVLAQERAPGPTRSDERRERLAKPPELGRQCGQLNEKSGTIGRFIAMKITLCLLATLLLSAAAAFAGPPADRHDDAKRLERATEVFSEIMRTPDKGIPEDLLNKSSCIAIIPGVTKAGFVVGGDYGKGIVTCRRPDGTFSAPSFLTIGGGSFGLQIGVERIDLVMLIMNRHGMERLISDKFTIGADASAAAGPVGRHTSADTDASLNAEILTYSRAKGLFGGLTLDGAVVKQDKHENHEFYGRDVTSREILMDGAVPVPGDAAPLINALARWSPEKQ
jgi:lipid-binding SYLF domain-containing protein